MMTSSTIDATTTPDIQPTPSNIPQMMNNDETGNDTGTPVA